MKAITSKILIFILILLTCLSGCKKDETKTTYQIINNLDGLSTDLKTYLSEKDPGMVQYLDGTLYDVMVMCYIGSDVVRTDNLGIISNKGGKSDLVDVELNYEKIIATFLFFPSDLTVDFPAHLRRFHTVTVTILEKGKNNILTIQLGTMTSNGSL